MAEPTGTQSEGQTAEKPKSKLPIIIGGFVVLLGIIGYVSMSMLSGKKEEKPEIEVKHEEVGFMYDFPNPFTVNLAPPDDNSLYSVNITIEIKPRRNVQEKEALEEVGIETEKKNVKMPMILDTISEIIGSKTRIQINSSAGRETMRKEIKDKINSYLEKAEVANVFLKNPILQ